jgi:HEAT repeat protein
MYISPGQIVTNTFDTLIAQLQSPDVKQRSHAALQLQPGTNKDAESISALVNVLCSDDDLNVVEDATWVLVKHGAAATMALLNKIQHDNPRARHNIAHALGKIADAQAVPALITATQDTETAVRLKSVYALGQIADVQAIDALIAKLDDSVQDVSWMAREVLLAFGDKALPQLIQALIKGSTQTRELSASLLGEIGDNRAVEPLIAALETDDAQVRLAIVEALGNIGDSRALPVVERMVSDTHPHVRTMANAVSKMLNKSKK